MAAVDLGFHAWMAITGLLLLFMAISSGHVRRMPVSPALIYLLAGVLLGAIVGQSVWVMRGLDPLFQILRTVPPLAWLPLSLAAFRDGQPSAVFVIFITSVWPIIINTAVGIRNATSSA